MPIRARLAMTRHVDVIGSMAFIFPIFRISCSFCRLWMNEPAHKNSAALVEACVEICINERFGWLSPMAAIIRPSWLSVDMAMIFLRSF